MDCLMGPSWTDWFRTENAPEHKRWRRYIPSEKRMTGSTNGGEAWEYHTDVVHAYWCLEREFG